MNNLELKSELRKLVSLAVDTIEVLESNQKDIHEVLVKAEDLESLLIGINKEGLFNIDDLESELVNDVLEESLNELWDGMYDLNVVLDDVLTNYPTLEYIKLVAEELPEMVDKVAQDSMFYESTYDAKEAVLEVCTKLEEMIKNV